MFEVLTSILAVTLIDGVRSLVTALARSTAIYLFAAQVGHPVPFVILMIVNMAAIICGARVSMDGRTEENMFSYTFTSMVTEMIVLASTFFFFSIAGALL